jgi:hypothetical protein
MEDTCDFENCEFAKCILSKKEQCPNYIQSWWIQSGTAGAKPKLVNDCAPKRTHLMVQELYNRLTGVEKSQEELRNETVWVEAVAMIMGKNAGIDIDKFIDARSKLLNLQNSEKLLSQKSDEKLLGE